MPAEYMNCMHTEMMDHGKSKEEAQKICAIGYYKRHGRTPMQDENKASLVDDLYISALAMMYDTIMAAKDQKGKKEEKDVKGLPRRNSTK